MDPGYKNGCKMAVLDEMGEVLDTCTAHLNAKVIRHEVND